MGATAIIAATLASGVQADQTAKSARFQQKSSEGRATARRGKADASRKDKEARESARKQQQQARQKQKGQASSAGRSSTILGGAPSVGNSGNQAQSGGGKTLLGS